MLVLHAKKLLRLALPARDKRQIPSTISRQPSTAEMAKGFTLYVAKAISSGRGGDVMGLAATNFWRHSGVAPK